MSGVRSPAEWLKRVVREIGRWLIILASILQCLDYSDSSDIEFVVALGNVGRYMAEL